MKYLVSGASGFLGKFIIAELGSKSYDTIGRKSSNTILFDLAQSNDYLHLPEKYDYLIIASGHAHLYEDNAREKLLHYKVNFKGTQKLVEAVDNESLKGVVYISTVAVYGENMKTPFKEADELFGVTPYAKSKIAAEEYLLDWSRKKNVPVLIFRVPLIVGKFPPGNLRAMIEAIRNKRYFSVAKGKARRSMVLADDLAKFVIASIGKHGIYNLSDGFHPSYRELEIVIANKLNLLPPKEMPLFLAKLVAFLGDFLPLFPINSVRLKKLTNDLIVDDSKARKELGWNPRSVAKYFKIE